MYPGQMAHLSLESGAEIAACATEILRIAQNVVAREQNELRRIIFSIFIAGFASADYNEKHLALHLLASLDEYSYDGNTSKIRLFLGQIFERQQTGREGGVGMVPVDWVEDMKRTGLRLVIFGI